jgi:O-antigen/teichoic acid export membrane protein
MDTETYGLTCIFITWVALLTKIVGLRIEGTIQNARLKYGENGLYKYCSSTLFLSTLFTIIILICSFILFKPIIFFEGITKKAWLFAVIISYCQFISELRKNYFIATKNATRDLGISCILASAQIILSLIFLCNDSFGNVYTNRIMGHSIPLLIIGIFVYAFFAVKGKKFVDFDCWKFCLSFSVPMIFNGIAFYVINQSDRLMINMIKGGSMAGIYSFAYNMALPVGIITQSLGAAWQPEYYELKAKKIQS